MQASAPVAVSSKSFIFTPEERQSGMHAKSRNEPFAADSPAVHNSRFLPPSVEIAEFELKLVKQIVSFSSPVVGDLLTFSVTR